MCSLHRAYRSVILRALQLTGCDGVVAMAAELIAAREEIKELRAMIAGLENDAIEAGESE